LALHSEAAINRRLFFFPLSNPFLQGISSIAIIIPTMNTLVLHTVATFLFLTSAALSPAQTPDRQQELASHLQKAQSYLRENHPDLAIPELKAAVDLDPSNIEVQANLGVLLFFRNDFADAIPHLRAALATSPDVLPKPLIKIKGLLGIAESRTGDINQALTDLEAVLPSITDTKFKTQAGLELVGLCVQTGDLVQAASTVDALRKSDPDNPEVMYAAYRTYSDLAGESMLALAIHAPDSAQMHQLMAHEETREGNTNGAVAQYRKAIAINPNLPGIHFELAELLNSSQDANVQKQAEQEYQAALKVNPLDERSTLRMAEILDKRGDSEGAMKSFTHAAELAPSDSDAKLGLAKVLIEKNQSAKALALLEETVKLEPTNATAHYRLGTLYREKGRAEDAKREIELYKKYKDEKEKLRLLLKEMQIQPSQIHLPDNRQDHEDK
jgi:tetratricopeptide (TPR) repeat protein